MAPNPPTSGRSSKLRFGQNRRWLWRRLLEKRARRPVDLFAEGVNMVRSDHGSRLDRAMLALMTSPARYPTDDDYERVRREGTAAFDLYGRRGWLDAPRSFHRTPPPLVGPDISRGFYPGLNYEAVHFQSGYEADPEDRAGDRWHRYVGNRDVPVWVLGRKTPERPWLICLHGLGTGYPVADFPGFRAAHLHRKLGLNLAFPVLPLHGSRRPSHLVPGSLLSFDLLNTVHGMAQAVWDVRRLISWLRSQGATQIGVYGISMGSYVAALLSAFEPLDMVLAGIPLCDVPSLFKYHSPPEHQQKSNDYRVLADDIRQIYRLISPLQFQPMLPVERRFLFAGVRDSITTPQQATRLWEAWERPTIEWYTGGHVAFFWSKQVERFVNRCLRQSGLVT